MIEEHFAIIQAFGKTMGAYCQTTGAFPRLFPEHARMVNANGIIIPVLFRIGREHARTIGAYRRIMQADRQAAGEYPKL